MIAIIAGAITLGYISLIQYVRKKYVNYFEHRKNSSPSKYRTSDCMKESTASTLNDSSPSSLLSTSNSSASGYGMDHVYLSFSQLLWAYTFVGLASYFKAMRGICILRLRKALHRMGLIDIKPFDKETLVGKLVLEQTQVINFTSMSLQGNNDNHAIFQIINFPYVHDQLGFKTADLSVTINVDTKKMIECTLDKDYLTPSQALTILFFNTIAGQHVKIHSLANWGVNCNNENAKHENSFSLLERNSIVTTMYNHAGYVGFSGFFDGWKQSGLLSPGWNSNDLKSVFDHSIKSQIPQHSQIAKLAPYSDLVDFVMKVRTIFFREFAKHKHLFPGIHCEALFAGTVLHSIDHALAEWNLKDPLWLDITDPKFGKMAEIGRLVRVGFIENLDGLYFCRKFKGSGHVFYESVYAKAAKINKRFADEMDTCICR